ncbi:hypothetical protein CDAR_380731 [Caerostris darwini]|uniref:Uncharacterized protein n=1 Tax=Caerostris darwini TaxID=1538125 RepID=A0AAV4QP85_9ARAC|nr:hypothetical protein CDAR_380731 [Caerostris darwini]
MDTDDEYMPVVRRSSTKWSVKSYEGTSLLAGYSVIVLWSHFHPTVFLSLFFCHGMLLPLFLRVYVCLSLSFLYGGFIFIGFILCESQNSRQNKSIQKHSTSFFGLGFISTVCSFPAWNTFVGRCFLSDYLRLHVRQIGWRPCPLMIVSFHWAKGSMMFLVFHVIARARIII